MARKARRENFSIIASCDVIYGRVLAYRAQVSLLNSVRSSESTKKLAQRASSGLFEWDSNLFELITVLCTITAQNIGPASAWPAGPPATPMFFKTLSSLFKYCDVAGVAISCNACSMHTYIANTYWSWSTGTGRICYHRHVLVYIQCQWLAVHICQFPKHTRASAYVTRMYESKHRLFSGELY